MFAVVMDIRYIGVPFHTFYYYWAEECSSLHQGFRYIGLRFNRVALYISKHFFGPKSLVFILYHEGSLEIIYSQTH